MEHCFLVILSNVLIILSMFLLLLSISLIDKTAVDICCYAEQLMDFIGRIFSFKCHVSY
jgi:hypothetical protein